MPHYNSYRSYIKKRFGVPVLTIPLNAGFSCPNRDGTLSSAGCAFCDNASFSPVAHSQASALDQLRNSMQHARRFAKFIAYLQSFSNTYGSIDAIKTIYEPLIAESGVVGLAVGTRPDCFTDEIYDYLALVNQRTYLNMEIGLQSATDAVLLRVNRGHTVLAFEQCVNNLYSRKISCTAHIMLGLPGETHASMIETAKLCARLPISGIKIHQLMIIKGTLLAAQYAARLITVFTIEDYAAVLGEFLQHLRPDQYIHRIMADSKPEHGLIAPLWSGSKMASLERINCYLDEEGIGQGDLFSP